VLRRPGRLRENEVDHGNETGLRQRLGRIGQHPPGIGRHQRKVADRQVRLGDDIHQDPDELIEHALDPRRREARPPVDETQGHPVPPLVQVEGQRELRQQVRGVQRLEIQP
jgi:hypothetical protein